MSPQPPTPELRGRRALVETLLHRAKTTPDRIFGSFAKTKSVSDGFHDFTFKDLANAVDACSWFIEAQYGRSKSFEPLLYLGVNDYRYAIVMFAAIQCGYKALFVNPRYPLQNILILMNQTGCSKVLYSPEILATVQQVLAYDPKYQAVELAPPLHWLTANTKRFAYNKSFEDSKDDPVLVLHSSGTTGAPKPVTYTNAWLAIQDMEWREIEGNPGGNVTFNEALNGGYTYSQYPQCHYGGVLYSNLRPLFTRSAASVLGAPGAEVNNPASLALDIIRAKDIKAISATPLLLENIFQLPGGIDALSKLNSVTFAGGPLRSDIGDTLVQKGVNLNSSYGTTELGSCPVVLAPAQDWQWTWFHPDLNASLEPTHDGTGTHELVFADKGKEINERRATFWSLGVSEYRTKDLFLQHPDKQWLWKYHSRTDDILVLENAGKINPVPIENTISAHPDVEGVLVAGAHRWPACILIEMHGQDTCQDEKLQKIAPNVDTANRSLREDLQIPLNMVTILKPGALVRGLKGQIMRKQSVQAHQELIDRLYMDRTQANGKLASHPDHCS